MLRDRFFWRWLILASAVLLLLLNAVLLHSSWIVYLAQAVVIFAVLLGIARVAYLVADAAAPRAWHETMVLLDPKGVQQIVRWSIFLVPLGIVVYLLLEGWSVPLITVGALTWLFFLLGVQSPQPSPSPYPQPPQSLPAPDETGQAEQSDASSSSLVERRYVWSYLLYRGSPERTFTLVLRINEKNVQQYRSRPRILDVSKWTHYPLSVSPEVMVCAADLRQKHTDSYFSSFDEICNTVCFVQHFPYSYDEETTGQLEYPRYPLETLYDTTGDCECLSILAASLLELLGYDVALLEYPQHIALGIAGANLFEGAFFRDAASGKRYYYAELTAEGWRVGEVPPALRNVTPRLLPVEGQFEILTAT